jgi:pyridoxamine 5'-phosphate oxidase
MSDELRTRLRGLRVFGEEGLPGLDPGAAPDSPEPLFLAWLGEAIDAGVRGPHAMTLSTIDVYGRPDSRVLLLKDVVDGRWAFATSRASRKGRQLLETPAAALNFFWAEQARQVRVRGRVADAGREAAARDYLERPEPSRAESLPGRQSRPLGDPSEVEAVAAEAAQRVAAEPDHVPDHWIVYHLIPDEVEFWQGRADRRHVRLRYERRAGAWSRTLLWP